MALVSGGELPRTNINSINQISSASYSFALGSRRGVTLAPPVWTGAARRICLSSARLVRIREVTCPTRRCPCSSTNRSWRFLSESVDFCLWLRVCLVVSFVFLLRSGDQCQCVRGLMYDVALICLSEGGNGSLLSRRTWLVSLSSLNVLRHTLGNCRLAERLIV